MIEKFNADNFKSTDTFRIISEDGIQKVYTLEYAIKEINNSGLDGIVMNTTVKPIIVKLGDYQKLLYSQKKKEKEIKKHQKEQMKPLKEVKFHIGIAQNDFNYKVQHIQDFLNKNCKVKIEIFLRGREVSMQDIAKELMNNILSNFSADKYKFSKITALNNTISVILE